MKVGQLLYADRVHPIGIERGTTRSFRFASTNLSSKLLTLVTFDHATAIGPHTLAWSGAPHLTGALPRVFVSDYQELLEIELDEKQQEAIWPLPVGINGCLETTDEEDTYTVRVESGSKLNIQLWAARFGSPVDGVLEIRDADGKQLAESDDQEKTSDPGVQQFEVPEDMDEIVIAVRDLQTRGGIGFNYRLSVEPDSRPDFRLRLDSGHLTIPYQQSIAVPRPRPAPRISWADCLGIRRTA